MDTASESFPTQGTPNSVLSSDFDDRDSSGESNRLHNPEDLRVLRLAKPQHNQNKKSAISNLKKDLNDSFKLHKLEDEKDLSLSSIEDERPNETNGFYSLQRNTSKNNLYITENFVTADSHLLGESRLELSLTPDVTQVEQKIERRKIVPRFVETPKVELTKTPQRVLGRVVDGTRDESAIIKYVEERNKKISLHSTPKPYSEPADGSIAEEFHSGVPDWCESSTHMLAMSTNVNQHIELESPDVISSSTQSLNFRKRMNARQCKEGREAAMKRLGVFDDLTAELEKALESLRVTVQPFAIPLPAASRGVGFATVAEYSRMVSAWDRTTVTELCTIHQYYRVELSLFYFKLFLARYSQNERESYPLSQPFTFEEEWRQILQTVNQVPLPFYNIICSLGKIEGSVVWHAFPVLEAPDTAEQAACYLYPSNIHQTLNVLSDANTPLDMRQGFRSLNPIPGVRWHDDLIVNAEQIWPEGYNANQLLEDTRAYSNLLTRAGNRLPRSFLSNYTWNPTASKTGTVCMYPTLSRLEARWRAGAPLVRRRRRNRRGPDGEQVPIEEDLPQQEYITDVMHNIPNVIEVWSPEHNITGLELTMGAASYVGECARYATRLQVNGRCTTAVSPGTVMYKMVDVPRS